jgi:hypothetical protein
VPRAYATRWMPTTAGRASRQQRTVVLMDAAARPCPHIESRAALFSSCIQYLTRFMTMTVFDADLPTAVANRVDAVADAS